MCNESVPGQEWKMAKMAVKMQFTFTFSDKSQQNVLLQRFTSNINMCVSIKLSPSCSITKDDIKKLTFLTINDDKKNEKSFQNITPSVFEILQSKSCREMVSGARRRKFNLSLVFWQLTGLSTKIHVVGEASKEKQILMSAGQYLVIT